MDIPDLNTALRGLRWGADGRGGGAPLHAGASHGRRRYRREGIGRSHGARSLEEQQDYGYRSELGIGGSSWSSPGRVPINVIELAYPWTDVALEAASRNTDPRGLPVLPLAYLVLMKLDAGRVQDIADITRMLGQADDAALGAVRRALADYAPEDADDVESLIALGRMELDDTD